MKKDYLLNVKVKMGLMCFVFLVILLPITRAQNNEIVTKIPADHTAGSTDNGQRNAAAELPNIGCMLRTANGDRYICEGEHNRVLKVSASGDTSVFAGNGKAGFSGDNGPAAAASLNEPAGLTVDQYNNIFISDFANSRVRKVDYAGIITTYAGNGSTGYSGDGGLASAAGIGSPAGLAIDGNEILYIADARNAVVRQVTHFGLISTLAGTGVPGHSGDGGPAIAAKIELPYSVYIEDNQLVIAGKRGNRMRIIDIDGNIRSAEDEKGEQPIKFEPVPGAIGK
jgi:hypothetical protein